MDAGLRETYTCLMKRLLAGVLSALIVAQSAEPAHAWHWGRRRRDDGNRTLNQIPTSSPRDCEDACRQYNDFDQRSRCRTSCDGMGTSYNQQTGQADTPKHRKWMVGMYLAIVGGIAASIAVANNSNKH